MTEITSDPEPSRMIKKYHDDLFVFLLAHNIERSEKSNYRKIDSGKMLCQRCTELWRLGEGKPILATRYVAFKDPEGNDEDVALCEVHADSIDDDYPDYTFVNMFDIDILEISSASGLGF